MNTAVHNIFAMNAHRMYEGTIKKKKESAEKLSSGYRINKSADNAAGLSISEKMRSQIRGLNRGQHNTEEGISYVQVGDGAMAEITEIVQRIRELALQASNETQSAGDREKINDEIQELKTEITRISVSTTFNDEKVFADDYDRKEANKPLDLFLSVDGDISGKAVEIYDATYDSDTGEVTFGGILYGEKRIPWDKIDSQLASIENGQQVYKKGVYLYRDEDTGISYKIESKGGTEVPTISQSLKISADARGFIIEGHSFKWSDLKNESKISPNGYIPKGTWYVDFEQRGGGTGRLYLDCKSSMSLQSMAKKLIKAGSRYNIKNNYIDRKDTQAVDAHTGRTNVSEVYADQLKKYLDIKPGPNFVTGTVPSYTVRASEDGIWLEDSQNQKIDSSMKTWADLGINDWMEGDDIRESLIYFYDDNDGNVDTYVSFTFNLDKVTSVDSVIDGLDGMKISCKDIQTKYKAELNWDQNSVDGLNKVTLEEIDEEISFWEELALGRDFDQQSYLLPSSSIECNKDTKMASLTFEDAAGNPIIQFEGSYDGLADNMNHDILTYLQRATAEKTADALNGTSNHKDDIFSLKDVLGDRAITTCGNLGGMQITIDKDAMELTDGKVTDDKEKETTTTEGSCKPGNTYSAAFIDFEGLGSRYTLDDLEWLGFDSTCRTCNNHYSFQFVDFDKAGIPVTGGTDNGNGYAFNYNKATTYNEKNQKVENYILQVNINSLKEKGVDSGEKLASALLEIVDQEFDFHYTQYAKDKDGSKFYILDNRKEPYKSRPATDATFDVKPYVVDESSFTLDLTTDGRKAQVSYQYNFSDVKNWVNVEMVQDNNGEYVELQDQLGTYYEKYDAAKHGQVDSSKRFNTSVSYQYNGTKYNTLEDAAKAYTQSKIEDVIQSVSISYKAMDYTSMTLDGDELENVAVEGRFNVSMVNNDMFQEPVPDTVPYAKSWLRIHHSSEQRDATYVPKFCMGLGALNLEGASTLQIYSAMNTIDMADDALAYVSQKRSIYGAYQNRMEHTLNNTANIEENTQAAETAIRDTDMAKEAVNLFKYQILEQAGQSMFAQANQSKQSVLSLLQ